jgi:hypothetical protein
MKKRVKPIKKPKEIRDNMIVEDPEDLRPSKPKDKVYNNLSSSHS